MSATLSALRTLIMQDDAVAAALGAIANAEEFVAEARAVAEARGIPFDEAAVQSLLLPDPLGLSRFTATPPVETSWPPPPWLPLEVLSLDGRPAVDWGYLGPAPLQAPFFADQARHASIRPINRVFGYRMMLEDVIAGARAADCLAPNGFIFHMSRCGSTLVAQMLAASASNIVISEAPPIDAVLDAGRQASEWADDALAAIVSALGRRRGGNERHYFVKLDCWHILSLPVFRRVFSNTPWIFLYRDPTEVLVSQMREPGSQLTPQLVPSSLYGIDPAFAVPGLDYSARVLGAVCTAAAIHYSAGDGLLVNYRELPEALFDRIMPHFSVRTGEPECGLMRRAADRDAKTPQLKFSGDVTSKQAQATPQLRAAAERHLGPIYRRLEALCAAGQRCTGNGAIAPEAKSR